MSLSTCAEIVRRGDPDRFLAAMAAPPKVRSALIPIYAFNVEIARAVWSLHEPMIARIRLQWWRDALQEIAGQGRVRNHEVVVPLAGVLDTETVSLLDALICVRHLDLERRPFEIEDELTEYLDRTAGNLMLAVSRAIGVLGFEYVIRDIAWASGLANLFLAVPRIRSKGYEPFADSSPTALQKLAGQGLVRLPGVQPPKQVRPVILATWRARRILRLAHCLPERIVSGKLGGSEFVRRVGLLWRAVAT